MQFVAFNTRLVLRPTLRVKIKRRLKEAIRLIVTRGAAVEKSSGGPKLVFRGGDVGADKWIVPGACILFHSTHRFFSTALCECRGAVFFYSCVARQTGRIWHCRPPRCFVCHLLSNLTLCVTRLEQSIEVERNLKRGQASECHIVRTFSPGGLGNISHTHCQPRAQGVDSVRHELSPKTNRPGTPQVQGSKSLNPST